MASISTFASKAPGYWALNGVTPADAADGRRVELPTSGWCRRVVVTAASRTVAGGDLYVAVYEAGEPVDEDPLPSSAEYIPAGQAREFLLAAHHRADPAYYLMVGGSSAVGFTVSITDYQE